jgi:hypothetical protein
MSALCPMLVMAVTELDEIDEQVRYCQLTGPQVTPKATMSMRIRSSDMQKSYILTAKFGLDSCCTFSSNTIADFSSTGSC